MRGESKFGLPTAPRSPGAEAEPPRLPLGLNSRFESSNASSHCADDSTLPSEHIRWRGPEADAPTPLTRPSLVGEASLPSPAPSAIPMAAYLVRILCMSRRIGLPLYSLGACHVGSLGFISLDTHPQEGRWLPLQRRRLAV